MPRKPHLKPKPNAFEFSGSKNKEASFKDDLGADSLDIAELVMELEDEFDMEIPDEEAEKINTVGDALDYIEKLENEK